MVFNKEADFEQALIDLLITKGWEDQILKNYTEEKLIKNWANILYTNNKDIDRLGKFPLTDGEMRQIIEQISALKKPHLLNGFINGGSVTIKRDNPDDKEHLGKEVSLKIYNRQEIAAGQSRYQIVQQPRFSKKSKIPNDRRGDLMLLINGMPVIHIELKKSGVPLSEAIEQIKTYADEGLFTGLFALVQIFVVMNPEEMLYFANPGPDREFNPDFFFHWADFNNEPINDWKRIGSRFLHIPMAHQLIGFYTVADDSDSTLKVMRSYQYYAASAVSDKVAETQWENDNQLGGYVWHTTGSGKTMTSFKSAQLIATSKKADKVVFLMDRIELGTQSLKEYRNFAGAGLTEEQKVNTVQDTEDTHVLIGKLKSTNPADTLIVTSIQKMSNVHREKSSLNTADIDAINLKRLVFIVDEAHRSTFGEMLQTIKQTFRKAIFFGFTGTPIQEENQKKNSTTSDVFGGELHRYSIADGIRDKNVLGFDPRMVLTFDDYEVRKTVALRKAKAVSEEEAMKDPAKKKVFLRYMQQVPMTRHRNRRGRFVKGIEDYLPKSQYRTEAHQSKVVEDILQKWTTLSQNNKFHAIFATHSIHEAVEYYHRFKKAKPELRVTALFDRNLDYTDGLKFKKDGLEEIISDYNQRYGQSFTMASFAKMKKDIAARLAHKNPYERIENEPDKQIDLLIVVDQMLTGYDSKWINTLYLDKLLKYENVIQAFSRTNRLFGSEKPFGTVKWYRKPHTMRKNIRKAVKLYSGDKPLGLFVQKLDKNLSAMNDLFAEIKDVFEQAGVENFERLPSDIDACKRFAILFHQFNESLQAAKIQGFSWKRSDYRFKNIKTGDRKTITVALDEITYQILLKRYQELASPGGGSPGFGGSDIPFDLKGYLTTIETDKIDADYMNSRFEKFLKTLHTEGVGAEELQKAKDELHKTFATLSQEDQNFALLFLHDYERGDVNLDPGKTLKDYITEYKSRAKDDQIHRLANALGLDEQMLRGIMVLHVTESNINEYGRFGKLLETVDKSRAKAYFEAISGSKLSVPKVNIEINALLRNFILKGGFDIDAPK